MLHAAQCWVYFLGSIVNGCCSSPMEKKSQNVSMPLWPLGWLWKIHFFSSETAAKVNFGIMYNVGVAPLGSDLRFLLSGSTLDFSCIRQLILSPNAEFLTPESLRSCWKCHFTAEKILILTKVDFSSINQSTNESLRLIDWFCTFPGKLPYGYNFWKNAKSDST